MVQLVLVEQFGGFETTRAQADAEVRTQVRRIWGRNFAKDPVRQGEPSAPSAPTMGRERSFEPDHVFPENRVAQRDCLNC